MFKSLVAAYKFIRFNFFPNSKDYFQKAKNSESNTEKVFYYLEKSIKKDPRNTESILYRINRRIFPLFSDEWITTTNLSIDGRNDHYRLIRIEIEYELLARLDLLYIEFFYNKKIDVLFYFYGVLDYRKCIDKDWSINGYTQREEIPKKEKEYFLEKSELNFKTYLELIRPYSYDIKDYNISSKDKKSVIIDSILRSWYYLADIYKKKELYSDAIDCYDSIIQFDYIGMWVGNNQIYSLKAEIKELQLQYNEAIIVMNTLMKDLNLVQKNPWNENWGVFRGTIAYYLLQRAYYFYKIYDQANAVQDLNNFMNLYYSNSNFGIEQDYKTIRTFIDKNEDKKSYVSDLPELPYQFNKFS
jgi:hypothetical protein